MSFEPVEPLWVGLFGHAVYRSRLSIDAVPIRPSCANRFELCMAFVPGKLGVTATNGGSWITTGTSEANPIQEEMDQDPRYGGNGARGVTR